MSEIVFKELEIIFINIILSVDNIGIIALAIKNLPELKAKRVKEIGIFAAVVLRLFFVAIVGMIYSIQWIPVNLIGGVILLYVTFSILQDGSKPQIKKKIKEKNAILLIIIADLSMSFDNVLIITSIAMGEADRFTKGQFWLIVLGVLVCIPVIFWGSNVVSELMNKYPVLIYFCAGVLIYTAIKMLFHDKLFMSVFPYFNKNFGTIAGLVFGAIIIFYGALKDRMNKKNV